MAEQQKPSNGGGGGDILLLAAGGVALYFLWPELSAMFSGSTTTATPTAVTTTATTPATTPTATPTASDVLTGAAYAAALADQQQATALFLAQQASAGAAAPVTGSPLQPLPPGSAPTPAPTIPQLPRITQPPVVLRPGINTGVLAPIKSPLTLAGIRRLGSTAAALIAQTALNNMVTDDAPQLTNSSPIGKWTPGATMTPTGCWRYGNTPVLLNCPPGVPPPAPRAPANGRCMPGYTMSASGTCASGAFSAVLAVLNSTPYNPAKQMPSRMPSPSIVNVYASTVGVNPGSCLAYLLGLPANPSNGVMEQGSDGFNYLPVNGIYVQQRTATQLTRPTGPIGPRVKPLPSKLQGLGWITNTLPITNATLTAASNDPTIATMVGNDPRAMLTLPQWNYFYTQASGVLQVAPPYPAVDPTALISATQYQAWRKASGLDTGKLGTIRRSRPGAFPLGSIANGPARRPYIQKGNNNIYRVPGRGAVRMGLIHSGGGDHRWERSPFPRAAGWRMAE